MIIHSSCAEQEYAGVVSPSIPIHRCAIIRVMRPVDNIIRIMLNQPHIPHPIPRLPRLIRIATIPTIKRQSGRQIKITSIRNAILVIIPRIKAENLPPQSAATSRIPPGFLRVEDGLCEREPAGAGSGVFEACFGGCHGGHAPEGLVVVAEGFGLICGHEVVFGACLVDHALFDYGVVGSVACVVPVIY